MRTTSLATTLVAALLTLAGVASASTPTVNFDMVNGAGPYLPGQGVHVAVSQSVLGDKVTAAGNTLGGGSPITARFEWDFGDTNAAARYNLLRGFNAAHVYDTPGTYTIKLTILNENGESNFFTRQVTISPDSRAFIYVSSAGNDNNDGSTPALAVKTFTKAMALLDTAGGNRRVLFNRGNSFTNLSLTYLKYSNVTFGAYGTGNRPILSAATGTGFFLTMGSFRPAHVVIQDLTITGVDVRTITAIHPAGTNVVIRNIDFPSASDAILSEDSNKGVLLLDNTASVTKRLFLWSSAPTQYLVILGNTAGDSLTEHNQRTYSDFVLAHDNNYTNTTVFEPNDKSLASLRAQEGSYIYWRGNITRAGQLYFGPLLPPDGHNPNGFVRWAVVEENRALQAPYQFNNGTIVRFYIGPNSQHLALRNNIFECANNRCLDIKTIQTITFNPGQTNEATVTMKSFDIRIYNNTIVNKDFGDGAYTGTGGTFVVASQGLTNSVDLRNNFYIAPALTTGAGNNASAWIEGRNDGLMMVASDHNVWANATPSQWAQGGQNYLYNTGGTQAGYKDPTEWAAVPQVHGDIFSDLATDSSYAPTGTNANIGTPVPGVWNDINGHPRSGSIWTAGAIDVTTPPAGIRPVADAYVQDGSNASTNFGTATTLQVKTGGSGFNRHTYLRFDISSVGSSVTNATLSLYGSLNSADSLDLSVYDVSDLTWGEMTINWNNKPAVGALASSNVVNMTSTTPQWYNWDLTSYIQSAKNAGNTAVSLAIKAGPPSTSAFASFNSDEAASNPPGLVVVSGAGSGDTTPPTVSITAPANGAFVRGNAVSVSATASDNVGVVGVQFKLDGANLGAEDTTSPYGITWDTTAASNGSHSLTAVARDAAGNTTTSIAVNVTVDNSAPTVSITSPANGAFVRGNAVAVSATASDNVGVVGVQFKLDGANLGTEDTSSPYGITWDTTAASNGSHSLTAVARDAAGNTTTSTAVNVTVDNSPPTVSITAPSAGLTVRGMAVAVVATASDNVGVAGVQFKLDGANLGAEDTTAPYSVGWNTLTSANGSHSLTAVARDAAGNTTTSTAVTVTVNNVLDTAVGAGLWINATVDNQVTTFTAEWDARPTASAVDLVMGLSNGAVAPTNTPTSYTNLAAAVRFGTNGLVDARNGAAYQAASSISYSANVDYHIRLVVNVTTHTYSAYVTAVGGSEQTIGLNYAFRTEQSAVTQLNNLASRDSVTSTSGLVGNAIAVDSALKAYLKLDEIAGVVAPDSSGNGNHGALAYGPVWTTGGIGGALDFDDVDDYVTLAGSATLTNLTQFTYAAWIFPVTAGENNFGRIFSRESSAGLDEFYFNVQSTTNFIGSVVVNSAGISFTTISSTQMTLNTWQHVAVTYNDTGDRKLHIYLNGVEVTYSAQPALTGTLKSTVNALTIGNRAASDRTFDGAIDDARVYNRVLTAAEILALP